MSEPLTLRLDPMHYVRLLELVERELRSERARVSAFRGRHDFSNEMVAETSRRQLLALREALSAGVKGASDEG